MIGDRYKVTSQNVSERERGREARQTDRQTASQTDRQTDRQLVKINKDREGRKKEKHRTPSKGKKKTKHWLYVGIVFILFFFSVCCASRCGHLNSSIILLACKFLWVCYPVSFLFASFKGYFRGCSHKFECLLTNNLSTRVLGNCPLFFPQKKSLPVNTWLTLTSTSY